MKNLPYYIYEVSSGEIVESGTNDPRVVAKLEAQLIAGLAIVTGVRGSQRNQKHTPKGLQDLTSEEREAMVEAKYSLSKGRTDNA